MHSKERTQIHAMKGLANARKAGLIKLAYLLKIEVDLLQGLVFLLQREDIGSISRCSVVFLFIVTPISICGILRGVVLNEAYVGPKKVDLAVRVTAVTDGCWW